MRRARPRRGAQRCAVAPALLLAAAAAPAFAETPPGFAPLGGGVAHRSLAHGAIAGHAFRFALDDVVLRLVAAPDGRARVDALVPAGDAIATNASFFDTEGRAMGMAVDRGRSLGGARLEAWSGLAIAGGRARILRGAGLARYRDAELVVQGLPRLVIDGAVPKLKPQRAARTAVCGDGAELTLVVTTTRVEAAELAAFLAAPQDEGGLGCRNALNLDGGPSTQLRARWGGFAADVPGGWGVPNALVVTPKADGARAR